jgi:hypothetical protein
MIHIDDIIRIQLQNYTIYCNKDKVNKKEQERQQKQYDYQRHLQYLNNRKTSQPIKTRFKMFKLWVWKVINNVKIKGEIF